MDWDKITAELSRKLDPANVRPPPKGKFGEYVDGHHVVTEANRIFGFEPVGFRSIGDRSLERFCDAAKVSKTEAKTAN